MQQPNIIEPLNFEEIFSRMKEELVKSFTALVESDPARLCCMATNVEE
nr:hypothetical protein [Wolbachia endosymbiont of Nilaparvata lugens]